MWRSNTAGRKVTTIDCRRSLPIWSAQVAVIAAAARRGARGQGCDLNNPDRLHAATTRSSGLVASLNQPGGNVTGVNFFTGELVSKRLALLHDLVPGAARVAAFINPADASRAEVFAGGS